MKPLKFTIEEAERAYDEWRFNCGPSAIAAIVGLLIAELRPHLKDFEAKGYTNPTLMFGILDSLGVFGRVMSQTPGGLQWPNFGLARIQWEGPWTKPGVPPQARYRHTHWVGVNAHDRLNIGIWDINALNNGSGWSSLAVWEKSVVPFILESCEPKADGKWHITHSVEVRPHA